MTAPWLPAEPLAGDVFAQVRQRAIFDCCKWDPQVEDAGTIADVPLILAAGVWREVAELAEALAREALAAEQELALRRDLHVRLGLPRDVLRALASGPVPLAMARLVRFDFHHTTDGWRISEANTDVPGGLNEASGLPMLMMPHYRSATPAGDVAGAYARAILSSVRGTHVALVHATAFVDDRQVMMYLSRRIADAGGRASLVSPAHLRWRSGHAHLATEWATGPVDAVVRFFPGEWLPALPSACGWTAFFHGAVTPISNPATALLTQSKRFPLTWPALRTPLPTWRALLPETRDPRDAPWRSDAGWVLKPALGRVGEDVGIPGVTPPAEWRRIARDATRDHGRWVAQRRFTASPIDVAGADVHPCIGVYTIDGRAVGAYGRLAARPLIDGRARDAAVLVAEGGVTGGHPV